MRRKIALEDSLTDVAQELKESGYEIVDMNNLQNADAVIVTGGDINMMGMQDMATRAPLIDARGLSAAEIRSEIEKKLT